MFAKQGASKVGELQSGSLQDRLWGPKLGFFRFFCRFGPLHGPFDLSTKAVALSHQGARIREVRNFSHWARCRDPNLLNWDLGRTSPWTPMESTDPLNSGGCDSSRLGSPNGRSCKLPVKIVWSVSEVVMFDPCQDEAASCRGHDDRQC